MSQKQNPVAVTFSDIFLWLIIGLSSIALVFCAIFFSQNTGTLVLLVIFGIIDLVAVLTYAGTLYFNTGMGSKNEALGLPNGSVRALIALGLIIIFAIMAIFMFTGLTTHFYTIPANQAIILSNGTYVNSGNGTRIFVEPNQAQQNFGLQTLTTVSTLVVALAGFYFGTKAVSTAKGTKKTEQHEITIQSVSISSASPSVTLILQSLIGATLGGIIIKDSSGNTVGTFAASNVIPNDGKLTTVTSTSWTPIGTGAIKAGASYTATVTTTTGGSFTSSSVAAT